MNSHILTLLKPAIQVLALLLLAFVVSSCSKVNFKGEAISTSKAACEGGTCDGRWLVQDWSQCSASCGSGDQYRDVQCVDGENNAIDSAQCAGEQPSRFRTCQILSCDGSGPRTGYAWMTTSWSQCSKPCGIGSRSREVSCVDVNGQTVADVLCSSNRPVAEESCNTHSCQGPQPVDKSYSTTVEPGSNKADILIVVDNSGSMAEDNMKLAQRLGGFVDDMAQSNIDWQMCITTTDMEVINGRPVIWVGAGTHIMTQQTSNKNQIFNDTIEAIGSGFSSDEQGIAAMTTLVLENHETNCLRDDAALSVIMISDENERSVGGNQNWSNVQYEPLQNINMPANFVSTVESVFGPDKNVSVNSIIVVPGDTTCEAQQDAQGSPSFFGTLYKELSDLTGGHVGSICDSDYSQNLNIVKENIQNTLASIELECAPINTPDIEFSPNLSTNVMIDGEKLVFDPALPQGTQVDIEYQCLP